MSDFFRKLFLPITKTLDFITKYFKTFVFLTILFLIFGSQETQSINPANLQKINLVGEIVEVDTLLEEINNAKNNINIKGVLLNVNSPGGAVAPSIEIAYAIRELTQIKPVVAYASGDMASGSYYASIWANKIIANPGSLVGSIGVIFQGFDTQKLITNLGISTQTIKAGKYKESGTLFRKWEEYEKEELQKVINSTYKMFVQNVANARKLNPQNHENFANARIFTAIDAKKVGLVDEVATLGFAQNELYNLSGVENPIWTKEDKIDKFLNKLMREAFFQFSLRFDEKLKAIF